MATKKEVEMALRVVDRGKCRLDCSRAPAKYSDDQLVRAILREGSLRKAARSLGVSATSAHFRLRALKDSLG